MATPNDRPLIFLDTNVLVYANVATAPHHPETLKALQQLRAAGRELWISRQVLREYAATVTRAQTFMTPLPAGMVVERLRYFETHFQVADDTAQVTLQLLALLESITLGGKQVHDANIVATMQAYGIPYLFTFNGADFERFGAQITTLSLEDIPRHLAANGESA